MRRISRATGGARCRARRAYFHRNGWRTLLSAGDYATHQCAGAAAARAEGAGQRGRRRRLADGLADLIITWLGQALRNGARMKLPNELGPIHFVGIGGIGMSGIAEVLLNLGYKVQGSDAAENANVKRLRAKGARVHIGHDAENLGEAAGRRRLDRDQARQSRTGRRARKAPAGRAPRRNAGRADAPQAMRRHRRHAWQDDDDLAGGDAARRRRPRSDRDQWRHHQRLWHQCASWRRRLDGGRGRRKRRHVSQAARRRRHRHQYRSRTSRPFPYVRRDQGSLPRLRREHALLRLRGDVPRSSDRAGARRPASRTAASSPMAKIRRPTCGCSTSISSGGVSHFNGAHPRPRDRAGDRARKSRAADAGPSQCAQRDGGDRGRASSSASAPSDPQGARRLWRRQAPLHPDRRMERRRRFSTITAIIPSKSPPCCAPRAPRPRARSSRSCSRIAIRGCSRFSMHFATCFNDADAVIIADVYPAGEAPIEGADRDALVAAIKAHGHRRAHGAAIAGSAARPDPRIVKPGDYVVCLGAGNITQWAYALPEQLAGKECGHEPQKGERDCLVLRHVAFEGLARAGRTAPFLWFCHAHLRGRRSSPCLKRRSRPATCSSFWAVLSAFTKPRPIPFFSRSSPPSRRGWR